MPRQKKKPAQRAFTSLAGREPGTTLAITPQPVVSKPIGPSEASNQAQVWKPPVSKPVGPGEPNKPQEPRSRAFTGMAGRNSDMVPTPAQPTLAEWEAEEKTKRAKAAREKRAARAADRKRIKELLKKPWTQVVSDTKAWLLKLDRTIPMGKGQFMPGAPPMVGRLVLGGFDSTKLDLIDGYNREIEVEGEESKDKKRVHHRGAGPDTFDGDLTADSADSGSESPVKRTWTDYDSGVPRALERLAVENIETLKNVVWCAVTETYRTAEEHRCEDCQEIGLCHLCFRVVHDDDEHLEEYHSKLVKERARKIREQDRKNRRDGAAILAAQKKTQAEQLAQAVLDADRKSQEERIKTLTRPVTG